MNKKIITQVFFDQGGKLMRSYALIINGKPAGILKIEEVKLTRTNIDNL